MRGNRPGATCDEALLALAVDGCSERAEWARRHQQRCPRCALTAGGGEADEQRIARITSLLPRPPQWVIVALLVLGCVQGVLTLPWLLGGDPLGLLGNYASSAHQARDGALGIVISVAATLTAWRPRWARPTFVISSVALVAQGLAGFLDGSIATTGLNEVIHVLSPATAGLLGLAAIPVPPLGPPRHPSIRAVDHPS